MPSTATKNILYRLALPVLAPRVPKSAIHPAIGHLLRNEQAFSRLIRKHRAQGVSILLATEKDQALILSDQTLAHPQDNLTDQTLAHPQGNQNRLQSVKPDSRPVSMFYRVASITKFATALTVMKLRDRGLLDIDRPVTDYLGGIACDPALSGVTLRHLLSHTSGLADPAGLETLLLRGDPLSSVLPGCRVSEPGSAFRYSNFGYGIIGCVLEAVADAPVSRVMDEAVFQPFALDATLEACTLPEEQIMPVARVLPWRGQCLRMTPLGKKPLDVADPARHFGHTAGSLYITVDSLNRLLSAFRDADPRLISPESRAEMLKTHARYGRLSPTLSYGLGLLFIEDSRLSPGRIVGHQGFAYGCADGAFYEENTGNILISLNGGCSEARDGRLSLFTRDLLRLGFRKELPAW